MRELTEYEKTKWFDQYHRFEMGDEGDSPFFLGYGCELGEAFDGALYCTDKESYGLSDWFVKAAQVQVLDMYYDQLLLYTGEYGGGDEPEDLGLPPKSVFLEKAKELKVDTIPYFGESLEDKHRILWDWCMEWREEHKEESIVRNDLKDLRRRLRAEEQHLQRLTTKG